MPPPTALPPLEKPADGAVPSSYLFDQPRDDHPWLDALSELDHDSAIGEQQVTANWRMDHRVAPFREEALLAPGGFPPVTDSGGKPFREARRKYFEQCLCRPVGTGSGSEPPAYLADANRDNRVPAYRVSPNHHLLHLVSLNALLRRALLGAYEDYDLKKEIKANIGQRLPAKVVPAKVKGIVEDLVTSLSAQNATEKSKSIRRLARCISDTLGPTEPHWWAAFAYEVEEHLQGGDWTEAAILLGLGHLNKGDWLMAWRYSPQVAGPLYRPTVLETNDNGFHFPSPPDENYGITMPLAEGRPLVRELVHAPLKGDICAESCIGRLGRIGGPFVDVEEDKMNAWYRSRRESHRQRLHESLATAPVRDWVRRHRNRA